MGQEACWRSVVCRVKYGEWVKRIVGGVWSVGSSMASELKELSAACGLSVQVCCVGQENCRRVWSVGSSMASGSKELSAEFGLWGRKGRVGQEACRQSLVCRGEKGEWVKRIVGGVWSVGTSLLRGSRGLLATCGLSGQVWRVGQGNWRRRVVCRVKFVAWVKRIVGGVWSVGSSMASGSRGLSAGVVCRGENVAWVKGIVGECGLSGQVWRVGQENCRRGVVCRGEKGEWVKRIVDGCGLSGRKGRVGQEACRWRLVCRRENGE